MKNEVMSMVEAVKFAEKVLGEDVTCIVGGSTFKHAMRTQVRLGVDAPESEEFGAVLYETLKKGIKASELERMGLDAESLEIVEALEKAAKVKGYIAQAQALIATGNVSAMRVMYASLLDLLSPAAINAADNTKINVISQAARARMLLEAEIRPENCMEMLFGTLAA